MLESVCALERGAEHSSGELMLELTCALQRCAQHSSGQLVALKCHAEGYWRQGRSAQVTHRVLKCACTLEQCTTTQVYSGEYYILCA